MVITSQDDHCSHCSCLGRWQGQSDWSMKHPSIYRELLHHHFLAKVRARAQTPLCVIRHCPFYYRTLWGMPSFWCCQSYNYDLTERSRRLWNVQNSAVSRPPGWGANRVAPAFTHHTICWVTPSFLRTCDGWYSHAPQTAMCILNFYESPQNTAQK